MKKLLTAGLTALLAGTLAAPSGGGSAPIPFAGRLLVQPRQAVVFAGNSLQFQATLLDPQTAQGAGAPIRWSLIGPGSITQSGLYRAPTTPGSATLVASTGDGLAVATSIRIVSPPPPHRRLVISSCYDDGMLNVYRAGDGDLLGSLTLGGRAAGLAVARNPGLLLVADETRLVVLDLTRMRWVAAPAGSDVRLSEVATLAWGLAAASNNDAPAGGRGIFVYRVSPSGMPHLVATAATGETPEGLATSDGGRVLFVSNINSNSVMRFAVTRSGRLHLTGLVHTAARPFGLAVDERDHELLVADNDTPTINGARARPGLERFDTRSLRRIGGIVPTGSVNALPLGVAVDAAAGRAFVTNEGESRVIVYALPNLRRLAELRVGLTPWLPALDAQEHRLYVPNARANSISIYDTRTLHRVLPDVATCSYPTSVAVAAPRR
jgi:hypothetical protein